MVQSLKIYNCYLPAKIKLAFYNLNNFLWKALLTKTWLECDCFNELLLAVELFDVE